MTSAMILAAGLGTRLAPLTDHCPKALVPLGDRPLLSHLASKLRDAGLTKIVVNAHHRADDVARFVRDTLPNLSVSEERDLLGTAGGLEHAKSLLGDGDVLIWNGDIVANVDLPALTEAHARAALEATLVVRMRPKNEGNVGIDAAGRVVRLRKETTRDGEIAGAEFLGVHVLGAKLRQALPEVGCLVGDVYLPALRRGESLGVHRYDGEFFDIGTPRSYLDANLGWLRETEGRLWCGKAARIDPAIEVDACILGHGASVTGQGALRRVVVWPDAHAEAPLEDAIVLPGVTFSVA